MLRRASAPRPTPAPNALFAEQFRRLLAVTGRAGLICPTGVATDDTTRAFFADLTATRTLCRLIGYENEAFIFPAVHHAFKFCALTMTGSGHLSQLSVLSWKQGVLPSPRAFVALLSSREKAADARGRGRS